MNTKWLVFISFAAVIFVCNAAPELSLDNVPNLDDVAIIKTRCDTKGGPGTYDKVKAAQEGFQSCVKDIGNVDTIKSELEEAKKTGSMDEVFGKYCRKRPELKACVDKVIDAIRPCLETSEKDAMNATMEILQQLGDFLCYRDGDRIAMFVAEGGVECIKSRIEGVKQCVNATFKIDPTSISVNSIPNLKVDKNKCNDLTTVQNCVVAELEKCKDSTSANIIDALFKFIKKAACKNKLRRRRSNNPITANNNFIVDKIKDVCMKANKQEIWLQLENTFNETKQCFDNNKQTSNKPMDFTAGLRNCRADLSKFQECLPEQSKFFPKFLDDLARSFADFLQTHGNKFDSNNRDNMVYFVCIRRLVSENKDREFRQCLVTHIDQTGFPDKKIFCRQLQEATNCVTEEVKQLCVKDILLDKVREDFSKAVMKPCQE